MKDVARFASAKYAVASLACALFFTLPAVAQLPTVADGYEATTIVTTLPKNGDAPPISMQQLKLEVNGKKTMPTTWKPYGKGTVELVLLIDNSARTSFGRNLQDLTDFVSGLPPNVAIGIAYMQNGAAIFAGPLTMDHAGAAKLLHLPGGSPGSNSSPYFCISDLAKRWPAPRSAARREALVITDGVDEYNLRYDPEDPYVQSAMADSQRAGIVLFPIYFRDQGRLSRNGYETNAGQNYLTQIADATGGNFYYEGLSNPVTFVPFFDDLTRRLNNQYELGFTAPVEKKPSLAQIKLKSDVSGVKVKAPDHVAVPGAGS